MTKRLSNWTFREVESFLKQNGFQLNYTNGSHFYYVGSCNGVLKNVCVPFHGNKTIKPRTLKGMILQSGISQEKWFNS